MRYNPRAKLDRNQVQNRREGNRFERTENNAHRTATYSALQRRLAKKNK